MNTKFLAIATILGVALLTPALVPQARAGTHVGVSLGFVLPHGAVEVVVGHDHYFTHRGVFYRHTPRGYVVVRAPRGACITHLPAFYTRIYVGNVAYYRCGDVYYQAVPQGYIVVDPPTTVVTSAPAAQTDPYQSVWLGDREYLFKDGQFFVKTPEGLVWTQAPVGAITKALPEDAKSVWYQDIEYFECDDVYFRKTPDGYRVITAPWKK